MFNNFLDRVKFKTKKIESLTIFKNFDKSVNKDTSDMIKEKTFSLRIQLKDHKETIIFRIISAMRNMYLKQS